MSDTAKALEYIEAVKTVSIHDLLLANRGGILNDEKFAQALYIRAVTNGANAHDKNDITNRIVDMLAGRVAGVKLRAEFLVDILPVEWAS